MAGKAKKVGNTRTNGKEIFLHGNLIARKTNLGIEITSAGWQTTTTKERLNGLLDQIGVGRIYQKNFNWYLNNKPWNGCWEFVFINNKVENKELQALDYI